MKYEFTGETKVVFGITLKRIRAVVSFGAVAMGDVGGWIESEKNLSQGYGDAWVYGNAQVTGNAWVYGDAQVSGNAQVTGNAWVYGDARVSGNARVIGNARVADDARVTGNAQVTGALLIAMRSDNYQFTVFPDKDGYTLLTAGCRGPWTLKEATAHWKRTRKGTLLGKESLAIIAAFKVQAKLRGWKVR